MHGITVVVVRALAGHLPLALLVGCGAAPAALDRGPRGEAHPVGTAPAETQAAAPVAGEPLDEASARRLLASRFRAAGLRILEDVTLDVEGVTLVVDGFDPARRIGYEYIAPEERDLELDAGERERLGAMAAVHILVAEPASAVDLERAAGAFLADAAARAPAPAAAGE